MASHNQLHPQHKPARDRFPVWHLTTSYIHNTSQQEIVSLYGISQPATSTTQASKRSFPCRASHNQLYPQHKPARDRFPVWHVHDATVKRSFPCRASHNQLHPQHKSARDRFPVGHHTTNYIHNTSQQEIVSL